MPESFEGFIIHASHERKTDASRLYLIGRLTTGETFAIVEERQCPGFYLRESDLSGAVEYLGNSGAGWDRCNFRTIDGERCIKTSWSLVQQYQRAAQDFTQRGIRTYEGDIRFTDQFLMSRYIHGSVNIKGNPKKGRRVDLIFVNPDIEPSDWNPSLSVLSLDIETDPHSSVIYAIGLAYWNPWAEQERQEVLFAGQIAPGEPIFGFQDERSMLLRFCERVVELDPDIITGWNVIDFDFKVIAERIKHHSLPFQIGRSSTPAAFISGERGRSNTIILPGRQVLDAVRLVRAAPERFSDYSLETVSSELLGRGKKLELKADESKPKAITRLYREDPTSLCRYCMEDARLVLDILNKTGLVELTLQRCLLIGISLDRAWTSIPAFDYLYIEALHRRGYVAPSLGVDAPPWITSQGGAILEPQTGLYDNVWVFDFKSLYPSIIRTFNIDPLSFVTQEKLEAITEKEQKSLIRAPNGAYFRRDPAILPELLERFFESRDRAKSHGDEVASYVYKIIMNAFYGVLGARGSRFASGYIAGAITSFGHLLLHWCENYFKKLGFRVLYGDTDSLFILSGFSQGTLKEELLEHSNKICKQINSDLHDYITESFRVDSYLELEFETIYYKFFLPPVRSVAVQEGKQIRGRAKGYAGLLVPVSELSGSARSQAQAGSGWIDVVGMEAVRRDWTQLARGFQIGLLELVFRGARSDAIREFVKKVVKDLYKGELDKKLVYRKALRKRVEEYTKNIPPHVRAASMLDPEDQRSLIHYLWTEQGPQPTCRLSDSPDYSHYVEKQLKPIAQGFTDVLHTDLEQLFSEEEQLWLF